MAETLFERETKLVNQAFKITDEIVDFYGHNRDILDAPQHALAYALTQYQYANLHCILSSELEELAGWMVQAGRWKETLEQVHTGNWEPIRLAIQEDGRGFLGGGDEEDEDLGTAFINLAWSLTA